MFTMSCRRSLRCTSGMSRITRCGWIWRSSEGRSCTSQASSSPSVRRLDRVLRLQVELDLDRDVLRHPARVVPAFADVEVEAIDLHRAGELRGAAAGGRGAERERHQGGLRRALERELAGRLIRPVGRLLDLLRLELRLGEFLDVEPVLVDERGVAVVIARVHAVELDGARDAALGRILRVEIDVRRERGEAAV